MVEIRAIDEEELSALPSTNALGLLRPHVQDRTCSDSTCEGHKTPGAVVDGKCTFCTADHCTQRVGKLMCGNGLKGGSHGRCLACFCRRRRNTETDAARKQVEERGGCFAVAARLRILFTCFNILPPIKDVFDGFPVLEFLHSSASGKLTSIEASTAQGTDLRVFLVKVGTDPCNITTCFLGVQGNPSTSASIGEDVCGIPHVSRHLEVTRVLYNGTHRVRHTTIHPNVVM